MTLLLNELMGTMFGAAEAYRQNAISDGDEYFKQLQRLSRRVECMVYHRIWEISGRPLGDNYFGEHAFHGQCGQSISQQAKVQALQDCANMLLEKIQKAVLESAMDSISFLPMTKAVTLLPCGHVLDANTVPSLINGCCPFDRQQITGKIANYNLRYLAEECSFIL